MSLFGKLTKAKIIDEVLKTNGFTRIQSIEAVEILIELIKQALESGDDVLISGFGKFSVNKKQGRRGRNPASGEDFFLVPRKVVTFHCSRKLREKLNKNNAEA